MNAIGLDLRVLARALDGEIRGEEVFCPGPGHSTKDRSLSVRLSSETEDGFMVHSFASDDPIACKDHVRAKLGLRPFSPKAAKRDWGEEVAHYIYKLADGAPYLRVCKFVNANGKKNFPQSHWSGGQWVNGRPKGEKIPYRLPELIAGPPTAPVYIVEGEKDADSLAKLSFVATTNSEGAGKWSSDLNPHFRGRHVVILPDNDAPGRAHAEAVAHTLKAFAASIRIVELPDLPPKGDVSDWLQRDLGGARLVKECDRAPLWEPGRKDKEKIAELAGLDKLGYGRARRESAKGLGVTATELDKIVAESRSADPGELPRWRIEPWDEPVSTATLLRSLADAYEKYVILPPHGANAMALWTLHAWALEASYVSPIIMFVSPEPRCGKSTALSLIYRTGPRTAMASNISAAAVYRYIESMRPTLLLDEAETFVSESEELRGVLNSGHTRDTAHVIRVVENGGDYQPKEFSTWAPKALASIGRLAATLRDRAIILPMKRRKPDEKVTKLRVDDAPQFLMLRRQAKRWAEDNVETLKQKRPALPDALNDRAQDNWEPLLAIADVAGGGWPALARNAALALTQDLDEGSIRVLLLTDIRKLFGEDTKDRMSSAALAARLGELAGGDDEAGPWLTYGKAVKPITQRQIAKLLAEFYIYPRDTRLPNEKNALKGYLLEQFKDAFERYLSPLPPIPSATVRQPSDINSLEPKSSATPDPLVADENSLNALKDKGCRTVADRNPPQPEKGVSSDDSAEPAQGERDDSSDRPYGGDGFL
jgi:Protein of unknown function (DUF3631)